MGEGLTSMGGGMPPMNLTGGTATSRGASDGTFRGGGVNITKGITGAQILIGFAVLAGGYVLLKSGALNRKEK